jgi:predicted nuclease of predicted toxin-antitoxin system
VSLRILLDQNVPAQAAESVRRARPFWEIRHVGEVGLWGASDLEILTWAQADRWIIVTYDEDFADARMFPVGSHAGVIRLRVWPTTIEETERALARVIAEVSEADLQGGLIIVDPERIRVRRGARHG